MNSGRHTPPKYDRDGIPTTYRGVRFRSRLEARWAAFYDHIGWPWIYEPLDLNGWIPDFAIMGQQPLLVEVKPALSTPELAEHADKIITAEPAHDVLIVGAAATPTGEHIWAGMAPAGWLLEPYDTGMYLQGTGMWTHCNQCDAIAVFHETASYTCRPCGHGNGARYIGTPPLDMLRDAWNTCANPTTWKPR